jgi:putative ribosome biogenesis GTPase RsgA
VELFEVYDGSIADTPGFSSLDYEIDNQPDLNAAFPEILRQSFGCKFRECTHTNLNVRSSLLLQQAIFYNPDMIITCYF